MTSLPNENDIKTGLRRARELRAAAFHETFGGIARWIGTSLTRTDAR